MRMVRMVRMVQMVMMVVVRMARTDGGRRGRPPRQTVRVKLGAVAIATLARQTVGLVAMIVAERRIVDGAAARVELIGKVHGRRLRHRRYGGGIGGGTVL